MIRGRRAVAAVAAVLAATLAASPAAPAAEAQLGQTVVADPVMLVVDTSGSMSRDDGTGRIKIEGAKSALLDFLKTVEPGMPIGLRTYPGSTSNSCDEGRLRFAVEPRDTRAMASEIRTLAADGDTPTAETMLAAARDLEAAGYTRGTMVILSDGESTCEDPCEAAQEIAASGIALETITVGFKISDAGREELRCIADAMNGEYVDADAGDALEEVFSRVSRPSVDISLTYPRQVVAEVGNDPNGLVRITGTVKNNGGQQARNVVARLRFDDGAPGVTHPVRFLGNLAAGEERRIDWTFRPSVLLEGETVKFTALIRVENGLTDGQASGEVKVLGERGAEHAGAILRRAGKLAILGDSYSSGEGAGDYFGHTDTDRNRCHRSRRTYLVEGFDIPDEHVIACSGAVVNDVEQPNWGNAVDAQVEQLADLDGDVAGVVMTMGGNDAEFGDIAKACLWKGRCDQQINGRDSDEFRAAELDEQLATDLRQAYRAISATINSEDRVRRRGEVAPLLVLGYPSVVPRSPRSFCPTTTFLTPEEIAFVVRFAADLNGLIEGAVNGARREGAHVFYVPNTEDAFQPDHTICDREPYGRSFESIGVRDVDIRTSLATAGAIFDGWDAFKEAAGDQAEAQVGRSIQEVMHPNADGYKAMTRAVVRWSLSPQARQAVEHLGQVEPEHPDVVESWPVSAVDLGQLDGQRVTIQGGTSYPLTFEGFAPGSQVQVVIRSSPRVLAVVEADDAGRVDTRVAIPVDMAAGEHTIEVTGVDGGAQRIARRILVEVDRRDPPGPVRGSLFGAGVLYLLAVVAWVAAAMLRRREARAA